MTLGTMELGCCAQWGAPKTNSSRDDLEGGDRGKGSIKRWSPGCVNAEGKARQKW